MSILVWCVVMLTIKNAAQNWTAMHNNKRGVTTVAKCCFLCEEETTGGKGFIKAISIFYSHASIILYSGHHFLKVCSGVYKM